MAETSEHASDSPILKQNNHLSFTIGPIHYEIHAEGRNDIYTVSDGRQTLSTPLLWAFGNGRVGQSYLFQKEDGQYYEARVSYFETLKNLHFTPSRALESPKDLNEAMARPVPWQEVQKCFSCHTTGAIIGSKLDTKGLKPGVSCEACHGPGANHVAAAQAAEMAGTPDAARGSILNAGKLKPSDAVDFCGACHISYWDMKLQHAEGVATSKSQPFRLEESKCWGKNGDARLTCTSCHDPHKPLQSDVAAYDHNCLECHSSRGAQKSATQLAAACPVGNEKCASCHMPREFTPNMHYAFTDHRIRVVKKDEVYPD